MKKKPAVSLIIPTFNNLACTSSFLASLRASAPADAEIVLVDNGSLDGTAAYILDFQKTWEDTKVLFLGRNRGYSVACNLGASISSSENLIFLNNDMIATPKSFTPYLRELRTPNVGAIGGRLLFPNRSIQHAGMGLFLYGHPFHKDLLKPTADHQNAHRRVVCGITGACIGIRRDLFLKMGEFDESFELLYQDIDLCFRVIASGRDVTYLPAAELYHLEAATRRSFQTDAMVTRDWKRFVAKWSRFQKSVARKSTEMLKKEISESTFLVWGTGRLSEIIAENLKRDRLLPDAFVNSAEDQWGRTFRNRKIISPSDIKSVRHPAILIASMYQHEINEIIRKQGISCRILQPEIPTRLVYEILRGNRATFGSSTITKKPTRLK